MRTCWSGMNMAGNVDLRSCWGVHVPFSTIEVYGEKIRDRDVSVGNRDVAFCMAVL